VCSRTNAWNRFAGLQRNTFFNAKDICGFVVHDVQSLIELSGYDEIQAVLSRECQGACSYQACYSALSSPSAGLSVCSRANAWNKFESLNNCNTNVTSS
jgi:hypothetical protein